MHILVFAFSILFLLNFDIAKADALRDAIRYGNVGLLKQELSGKPELEPRCPPNYNCKLFGYAAGFGNIEIIKLLIEAGADPDGLGAYLISSQILLDCRPFRR